MRIAVRRAPIQPESEAHFQAAIVDLARRLGWRTYHTHDSRRSAAGFPDIVAVKPPRLLFIETKAARGRLTADQQGWLEDLAQCSAPWTLVWRAGTDSLTAIAEILKGNG